MLLVVVRAAGIRVERGDGECRKEGGETRKNTDVAFKSAGVSHKGWE